MNEKLSEALGRFIHCFGYIPAHPDELDFNQDEYADFLNKCISDKKDYTIEKYGTVPPKNFEPPKIFID